MITLSWHINTKMATRRNAAFRCRGLSWRRTPQGIFLHYSYGCMGHATWTYKHAKSCEIPVKPWKNAASWHRRLRKLVRKSSQLFCCVLRTLTSLVHDGMLQLKRSGERHGTHRRPSTRQEPLLYSQAADQCTSKWAFSGLIWMYKPAAVTCVMQPYRTLTCRLWRNKVASTLLNPEGLWLYHQLIFESILSPHSLPSGIVTGVNNSDFSNWAGFHEGLPRTRTTCTCVPPHASCLWKTILASPDAPTEQI